MNQYEIIRAVVLATVVIIAVVPYILILYFKRTKNETKMSEL